MLPGSDQLHAVHDINSELIYIQRKALSMEKKENEDLYFAVCSKVGKPNSLV
jgi:hypothetical protein